MANRTSCTTSQGTTTYTHRRAESAGKTAPTSDGHHHLRLRRCGQAGISTAYPNGVTSTHSYDTLDRLVQVANTGPGGLISSYAYTLGHRKPIAGRGDRARYYGSDGRLHVRRVVSAHPGADHRAANPVVTIGYSYDAVGNRTQMNRNGTVTNYTYDTSDRLITEVSGPSTLTSTYDDNGNLTVVSNGSSNTIYGYDAENRLLGVNEPRRYGELHLRCGRHAHRQHEWGCNDRVPARQESRFYPGPCGDRRCEYAYVHLRRSTDQSAANPVAAHILPRRRGSSPTRQLTNAAGVVSDSYTCRRTFGVALASAGPTANAYRYAGEQLDPSLGV